MEAAFLKFAFFLLMGLATLSLLAIVTMFAAVGIKALSSWLRAHARIFRAGHV